MSRLLALLVVALAACSGSDPAVLTVSTACDGKCGPAPSWSRTQTCEDGTPVFTGRCLRAGDGFCSWEKRSCADPGECRSTGCDGETCSDVDLITRCDAVPWVTCLHKYSRCWRNPAGSCAWVLNDNTTNCISRWTVGPACDPDAPCASDQYCASDACGARGVCRPKPTACTDEDAPACGCDGVTHRNTCSASAAGVAIRSVGRC